MAAAAYDLSSTEFFVDPSSTFRRMREETPVYFHEPLGVWILTRYDHCGAAVRDPRLSNARARELIETMMPPLRGTPDLEPMAAQWSRLLWFLDPPAHTRCRAMVNRGFSAAALARWRPAMDSIVGAALDAVRDQEIVDVPVDFADPIAIHAITELFGVPANDRDQFRRWTVDVLKVAGAGVTDEATSRRVKESSASLFGYISALVEERRERPGDDMLSLFLGDERDDPAVVEEVVIQGVQTLGAGYATSQNQISNAVLSLLRHPAELARLREDRGLLKGAIEEVLRHEPSVLTTNRLTKEPVEIGGTTIPKGTLIFPAIAAANRDPEVFDDPDRFDIGRTGAQHLTFSLGPHYCVGGALVRMQMEAALRALLEFPRWELAGDCAWGAPNLQDRGPKALPVRFLRS